MQLCWLLPSVHRILLPLLLEMRDVPCSCLTLCVRALGTSVQKPAACTSPIFLFFHFPLVKDIELLGEWRTDLLVFREYVGRCLANRANTRRVCPVRKASTSAVNRNTQDNSGPIMLLYRTHPRMKTLFSPYAARR